MVEFWPHTIEILLAIDDPREIIGMGNVAGSDGCVQAEHGAFCWKD
jgi:hypothetical protein